MTTRAGVATVLAYLHELYPGRQVTAETGAAWLNATNDLQDAVLLALARAYAADPESRYFPAPSQLRGYLPKHAAEALPDLESTLRAIDGMGHYDPRAGWVRPRKETVQEKLGPAIAFAYGYVGPSLLFSENEQTRSIALRDFRLALEEASADLSAGRLIAGDPAPPQLESGE